MKTESTVTHEMREAGGMALFKELGLQNSPEHIDLEDLAVLVWKAMNEANSSATSLREPIRIDA